MAEITAPETPPRWVMDDPGPEDEAPEGDADLDCAGDVEDDDGMDGVDLPDVEDDDDGQ